MNPFRGITLTLYLNSIKTVLSFHYFPKMVFSLHDFQDFCTYCCLYHDAILQSIAPNYSTYLKKKPVPVTARSKAYVCGRWPAETMGSNPAGGMDVCCECWVLSGRGLCVGLITRPEESCRVWCV